MVQRSPDAAPVETAPSAGRRRALRVGEAAEASGVGIQTLHYYEREGLIEAPPRSPAASSLRRPSPGVGDSGYSSPTRATPPGWRSVWRVRL
jgi:hypothetical protein